MTESKEQTAIAKSDAHAFPLIPEEWGANRQFGQWITSLDKTKPDQKRMLLSHVNEEGRKPEDFINVPFEAIHVSVFPIEFEDRETPGEIVKTTRICLETLSNGFIEFRSDGVLKSLYAIMHLERMPPWNPPIKLVLQRRQLGTGRSMYVLSLAPKQAAK